MREFATGFYTSNAWRDCRKAYRKSVGGLCEVCLSRGIYKPGEIVHHRKPLTPENINNPEITLAWSNLQLVCRECHAQIHGEKHARYVVHEDGSISPQGE